MYYEIVLAGVAISLLFVELTGLSPAGLIVPGYLALCLQTPWRIVYTLAVAVAAWGIAKLLGNVMILYGRRRFAVMVLLSFAIDLAVTSLGLLAYDPGMIGVLVPGIMAQELERQGYIYTVKGKGSFVADNQAMKENKKKEVLLKVSDMIDEAIRVGIPGEEIKNMVEIQYEAARKNGGGDE